MRLNFKSLRLNLGVSETLEAFLLSPETWERIWLPWGSAPMDGPWSLGLDLGTNASMCSRRRVLAGDRRSSDDGNLFRAEPNL